MYDCDYLSTIRVKNCVFVWQEKQLEYAVVDILERASATDYMSTFARHRITIETLCQMSEEDLKQVRIIHYLLLC